ncbi:MAG: ABC transporter ATP-binding protein [Verrucomicrobiales bacterium]
MPEAPAEPILTAANLRKVYDGEVAVADLSLELRRGEIVGLLGVNGAGKTTTMNMLLGLTYPDGGAIRAFGMDLRKHRAAILRRANFSSAYADLPGNLLAWQNLYVFAKIYGVPEPKQRIAELLEMFEIAHLRNHVTGRLSSGESTRLNLCKALLNKPELLMLDEPTASLDPDIADKVRKAILDVQSRSAMGILYTSHNMRDIEEICDRIIFIHGGKILAQGTPDEIKAAFDQDSLEGVFIRVARSGEVVDGQQTTNQ